MTGLAPQTLKIFPSIASLQCINGFHLVGGTALSLQINHRLSEDLDFCKWADVTSAKNSIDYKDIQLELDQTFSGVHVNALSFDQVDFRIDGVKITFFNEVGLNKPDYDPIDVQGISCVPVDVICAMKIKTIFERTVFRDYYDIYTLIKDEHISMEDAIESAISYQSKLRRPLIVNRLKGWRKFNDEKNFVQLSPKHEVKSKEIGDFFHKLL